jgi:8-oxo-dGTP diphosphatase
MTTNLWEGEPRLFRLAAGVYVVRDGKVALLQRAGGAMVGFWSLPGGMVDGDENPLTAGVRELHEESGLTPAGPVEFLSVVPLRAYNLEILRFHYVAACDEGEIRISDEHSDGAWFDPVEYRSEHLSDAEVERWGASSASDAFNVLANREAIDALIEWMER